MASKAPAKAAVAGEDIVQVLALLVACALALVVGFVLAMVLPGAAALSAPWGERWRALVQVHGQTMVLGWAGLFILGMAGRLIPRFSRMPLQRPVLLRAGLALIGGGVILRTLTQPLADAAPARVLLFASGLLVLGGAVCFAIPGLLTLTRPLRERQAFAYIAAGGLIWLVVAAALIVRALARVLADGGMVVSLADDTPILYAEFFGFLLGFIIAITLRSVPVLYRWPTPRALPWVSLALMQSGTLAIVIAALVGNGPHGAWWLGCTGDVLLGCGLLAATGCMGVWRRPERLRANVRLIGLILRSAYGWAAAAALLLFYGAGRGFLDRVPPPDYIDDAVRHMIGIGIVSMLILGMAYMVGHMFAEERANDPRLTLRVRSYHVLLSTAAFLRAGAALLEPAGAPLWRYWLMSAAGVCAFIAVAWFTYRLVWGLRHHYVPPLAGSTEGS